MNDYVLEDNGKCALFHIALAYAGSVKTNKEEFKKLVSAMLIEYIGRNDISLDEIIDIWDELKEYSLNYIKYLEENKLYKEDEDERKDS